MKDFDQIKSAFLICHDERCTARLLSEASKVQSCFITHHDKDGIYLSVSSGFIAMLHYEPEDVIGTSAYDYFHPDDLASVLRSHTEVTLESGTVSVSYRLRTKKGNYLLVTTLSRPIVNRTTGMQEIVTLTRENR